MPRSRLPGNIRPIRALGLGLTLAFGALAGSGAGGSSGSHAHFVVTDQVVAPDPGPFTATLGRVANGSKFFGSGSGFEPPIYRNWIRAGADSEDRILAEPRVISSWDTLATGALDGAEIDVLRLENGAFRLVRRDRVPEGGFQASGWAPVLPRMRAIPPSATSYMFAWSPWNRPDAPYYFTLRAVDSQGRVSAPATPVMAQSPKKIPRKTPPRGKTVAVKETAPGPGPGAPLNLTARTTPQGTLMLNWSPAQGDVAGYLLERSDLPPESHRGFFIDLAQKGGPPIKKGDLISIRKTVTDPSRADWLTNRVWGAHGAQKLIAQPLVGFLPGETRGKSWRLAPHPPDTKVTEPGQTYLELSLARGAKARIGKTAFGGPEQDWYPVLEAGRPYRMEVWLRADRPTRVTFAVTGFYAKPPHRIAPATFDVGPEWKQYSATFTPPAAQTVKKLGQFMLTAKGPVTLDIDNFRVSRDDAPYLGLLPEDAARLARSGMGALRTHSLVKTRQHSYDLAQLTDPGGLPSGTKGQTSLPQLLEMIDRAGMDPWLQIEPHFTPEEWLGLIEYLAAPYDPAKDSPETKPWAAKRVAQGRSAPWVDAFDRLYFEIGNETWNRLFAPWIFAAATDAATGEKYPPGAVYGLYQEYVSTILRQSPYWTPALEQKFITVLGGWEYGVRFGIMAARHAPSADILTTAPYIGGWEAKAAVPRETPEDFFRLLTHMLQTSGPQAEKHVREVRALNAERGRELVLGTYEAGPGYLLNGLNGAKVGPEEAALQERVMKSKAAGTATLDAFLNRALDGYRLQNFFTYGPGARWTSHALPQRGGQDYPSWMLLSAFNREATGDFLAVETREVPRADLPEARRRKGVDDAPLVGLYATRHGDRLALIVVSRQVPGVTGGDGHARVVVDLPITGAKRLSRLSLTGEYNSHNVDADRVRLVETDLGAPTGLPRLEIPDLAPGSTEIYVFEGIR